MAHSDLNLLTALDALLVEGSVVGAALAAQSVRDESDPRVTFRSNEGFVEVFAGRLVAALALVAPSARLHFVSKPDKNQRQ